MSKYETHDDYSNVVYQSNTFRIIRCRDDIQYIYQKYSGGRWHSKSFHIRWQSIAARYRDLYIPSEPIVALEAA